MRKKKKRKPKASMNEAKAQLIAKIICRNQYTLKQIAADFNLSYSTVHKILRERVNVQRVLTLKYPEDLVLYTSPVSPPTPDK